MLKKQKNRTHLGKQASLSKICHEVNYMSFGERLRQLRKMKSMTQKEMAQLLNITYVAYGDYERDKSLPDIFSLKKIANILDVSCDYLLDNEKELYNFTPEEVDQITFAIEILNKHFK